MAVPSNFSALTVIGFVAVWIASLNQIIGPRSTWAPVCSYFLMAALRFPAKIVCHALVGLVYECDMMDRMDFVEM